MKRHIIKTRISGDEVEALHLTGSVKNRVPVIVDDMISTAGTVAATIEAVLENGGDRRIYVAASHGLFTGNAVENLSAYPIEKMLVSDSISGTEHGGLPLEEIGLWQTIAERIDGR